MESCFKKSLISDSNPTGVFPVINRADDFVCEYETPQNRNDTKSIKRQFLFIYSAYFLFSEKFHLNNRPIHTDGIFLPSQKMSLVHWHCQIAFSLSQAVRFDPLDYACLKEVFCKSLLF